MTNQQLSALLLPLFNEVGVSIAEFDRDELAMLYWRLSNLAKRKNISFDKSFLLIVEKGISVAEGAEEQLTLDLQEELDTTDTDTEEREPCEVILLSDRRKNHE